MQNIDKAYVSVRNAERLATQARRVWFAALLVAGVWLFTILAPPVLHLLGFSSAAASIFGFFGNICHQLPERSFFLCEFQFGVCSRCFGVYFGLSAGILTYPLWRAVDDIEPLPRIWLFASIVPLAVDWSLTAFGIWQNNHFTRFTTGLILGFGCAVYIVPALVEIVRHLTIRRSDAI